MRLVILKVENFIYEYRLKNVFQNVNFYFEDCQLNFILGENGIGKTTILDCIANVDEAKDDSFLGFPNNWEIAYLAQENGFNVGLTASKIICFVKQLEGNVQLEVPNIIEEILHFKFIDLTIEERKLLLIYLNTMVDRELYLFDDPEKYLRLSYSQMVFEWLRQLVDLGKTVIVATNRLDNIFDTDNVNYIKNNQEVLADSYLKIKGRMAF